MLTLIAVMMLAQAPADLSEKAKAAQEHMAAERYREAIPLLDDLVKAAPNSAGLLLYLGMAQFSVGDSAAAEGNLARAVEIDSSLYPANLFLGLARLDLDRAELAVPPLRKALELRPGEAQARQVLADALSATGNYNDAAAEYGTVTEQAPSNTHAWYALGQVRERLADRVYEELAGKASEDSIYALAVKAHQLIDEGDYEQASEMFDEVLARDSDFVSAHVALSDIYQAVEQPEWAAEERAIVDELDCTAHGLACKLYRGEPDAVVSATAGQQTEQALYLRAQAYSMLAKQAFGKLEELPPSKEMYMHRADRYRKAGQRDRVTEELEKAVGLAPGDRTLRIEYARELGFQGRTEEVLEIVRGLLEEEPDAPELNALAGMALMTEGTPEEAIPYFEKALVQGPGDLATRAELGRAYMQIGEPKRALPHLEAAAAIDDDGRIHYTLSIAYRSTDQPERAQEALARYKELSATAKEPDQAGR